MAEPPDQMPAAARRGHLRASHADREQVVETLKTAFVQGRLTKAEMDARVGRAFAARTYADLAMLTADLPAGLAAAQPPRPARAQARPQMSNAAKAGICIVIAVAVAVIVSIPTGGAALVLFVPFYFMGLLVAGAQIIASRREKRSGGQRPGRPAPGTGSQVPRYLPSADPGRQLPPGGPGHRQAAEAARRRLPRQPLLVRRAAQPLPGSGG